MTLWDGIFVAVVSGLILALLLGLFNRLRKRASVRRPSLELVRSRDGSYWHFRLARKRAIYDIRVREDFLDVPPDGAIRDFVGDAGFALDMPRISDAWREAHITWVDGKRYGVVLHRGDPDQHVYAVLPERMGPEPWWRRLLA